MKYIITEQQNKLIHIRRRFHEDIELISDIVVEGMDLYLCDSDDYEKFFERVVSSSVMTYLFHYFNRENEEGYKEMERIMIDFIKKRYTRLIEEVWHNSKEDCL